ncbi:MAG TPA: STAS domain-containing protein [Gemmataceae bacterium]|nr:STAS domain-containing protein [Gemmataceae bacterium]
MTSQDLFDIERDGDVLVIVPKTDLGESEYDGLEAAAHLIFDELAKGGVRGVVLDFQRTDYCGSTALGLFIRLWKRVCERGGRMAFCNVSEHEKEVLAVTRLDSLWPICPTRQEALKAVTA